MRELSRPTIPAMSSVLLAIAVIGCAPTGKHLRVESFTERDFDEQTMVFFNESLESLSLNKLEKAVMSRIGLDPNSSDDYALLAFIVRGFHLRYYTWKRDDPKNDLGVYLYNLDGVRVGQAIPILDASALEGVRSSQLGPILHRIFDPIRRSREPRAIVAVAPDRTGESLWRRIFINPFAEKVHFAKRGTAVITSMQSRPGAPLERIQIPVKGLTDLGLRVDGERDGRKWWLQPQGVRLTISSRQQ